MRLFIAIDLGKEIKDYLYELQKELKNNSAKISWVAKKNLHVTLKFLGEIKEDKLEEIKKALREVKFESFNLEISKIGFFPHEFDINVIWVGFTNEKQIEELQKRIDEETIGLSKEGIKLGGHVTLGRVKSIKNKVVLVKKLKEVQIEKLNVNIKEFKLYKSELKKEGPAYEVLESFKLN